MKVEENQNMHNILLLTVDCLRADSLGSLGYDRRLSPNIDQLAAKSVLFRQAFATGPRTTESFPAIQASTYPLAFGATFTLPKHLRTLAEVLRHQGYATAAFHSNPFLLSKFGYGRGFAHYWDSREKTAISSKVGARVALRLDPDSRLYRFLRRLIRRFETQTGVSFYVRAEDINRRAVDWLWQASQPFFLWIHYMDMHYPFSPPERCVRQVRPKGVSKQQQARLMVQTLEEPASVTEDGARIYRDLYDAGLLYVDENVGALLNDLREMGHLDNTAVFLTADHGEEFREHGDFGHGAGIHVPDAGLPPIKLYDELLHVPLIIHAPALGRAAGQVDALASLVDLPPTIVDLLGLPAVDSWHGRSLLPLMQAKVDQVRKEVFSEYAVRGRGFSKPVVACRTDRWKYIHDGAFDRHQLYDLVADPEEQHNLYCSGIPALSDLQDRVGDHLALTRYATPPATEAEVDPEVAERLRGLGYLS